MKFLVLILTLSITSPVAALTSWDQCIQADPCDQHLLEWRGDPIDPWIIVGPPLPLSIVTHPQVVDPFRGVIWTGFMKFGEFRALAMRARQMSPPSNVIDLGPEPPAPSVSSPQLLSSSRSRIPTPSL